MVKKGIVLDYVVSTDDIEVDKVKIDLIPNLPPLCERGYVFSWTC